MLICTLSCLDHNSTETALDMENFYLLLPSE